MIDNILINYFNERFHESRNRSVKRKKGPVITISRMAGCPAGLVAEGLLERLKKEKIGPDPKNWHIISKEILSEAARELGLSEQKINYVFTSGVRTTMDEVIAALANRYYKSDSKIRKTIADVIRTIAAEGSVIIVGRAGVALTQDIPGSLHIRLQAPEPWRVEKLMNKHGWDREKATQEARDRDKRRQGLIRDFGHIEDLNQLFHITFNCEKLPREFILDTILNLIRQNSK